HPYTRMLYASVPIPDPVVEIRRQTESISDIAEIGIRPERGCKFAPRCRYADEMCFVERPLLTRSGDGHFVACHHPCENIASSNEVRCVIF
ncbi:MAG: hypothetical protein LBS53_12610, partial [Synergistaceae bacterium]|nr:hypothetical protein [Synergistaceae bacterium]